MCRAGNDHEHRVFDRIELWAAAGVAAENRRRFRSQIPRVECRVEILVGRRCSVRGFLQADEIQRLRIRAPRRGAVLGAVDGSGDLRAGRGVVDEQRCFFRSTRGDADRNLRAVGRRQEIVDRIGGAAVARAQRADVHQRACTVLIANAQVELVGARCTFLVERAPAMDAIALHETEAAREVRYALQQRSARADRIEYASCVVALRLHPRDGFASHLFEVAIRIGNRRAEQRFRYRIGRCERRWCDAERCERIAIGRERRNRKCRN